MELRHLRYFVAVAEELHFGRAAIRLGVSQPPLSQQIRALENELRVELFQRTSRRVRLTEPGKAFLVEARKSLAQVDHAVATARRADRGELGDLAIGFITSAPLTPLLSKALFQFRTGYPAVHLDLAELARSEQIDRLVDRTLDAGFVRGIEPPLLPPSLVATMLVEEDIVLALRADHPLAGVDSVRIADLAEESFVLYENALSSGLNEHLATLCRDAGFEPRVAQEVGGLATLLGLVAAGFGITILTRSLASLRLDDLVYRKLDTPDAVSRLWLIHHRDMSPSCRRLVDIVTGAAQVRAGDRS